FVIAGYSLVLLLHFIMSVVAYRATGANHLPGSSLWPIQFQSWLMIPGIPLAAMAAVYTAYLFAQAKARDMLQNPLLPPRLLVHALLLGSAALLPFAAWLEPTTRFAADVIAPLLWLLAITSLLHVLMIWGEVSLTHSTAHARVAVWEMVSGR